MDIKTFWKESMLNKLLIINIGVWLAIKLLEVISFLFGIQITNIIIDFLSLPANLNVFIPGSLPFRFWTLITYMFTHEKFLHILGNMLWLFFMGRMFLNMFNNKQMLGVYILGGLSGALFFVLAYNIFPVFSGIKAHAICIGASASVTAIIIALCVARPNTEVRIFGLIPITLKWLGIIYVAYDVLQINSDNPGGHIAHIGGAVFGLLFAIQIIKGKDLTSGFNKLIDWIVSIFQPKSRKTNMRITYNSYTRDADIVDDKYQNMSDGDYNQRKAQNQERIDSILDKISKSGYDSLTKEEKEFLFKASRK